MAPYLGEFMEAKNFPAKLAIQENSHSVAKLKPKIRIVHIFTPEIIKTDPANFRETVQKLTGKPSTPVTVKTKKTVKKEVDGGLWESSGGFLKEIDGFLQDLNDFPVLSTLSCSNYTIDVVRGAQVLN